MIIPHSTSFFLLKEDLGIIYHHPKKETQETLACGTILSDRVLAIVYFGDYHYYPRAISRRHNNVKKLS
jgi:hypothetical protein